LKRRRLIASDSGSRDYGAPPRRTLVDTSVWIEYLRNPALPGGDRLQSRLKKGALVTSGVVVAELLSGARSDRDRKLVEILLDAMDSLDCGRGAWAEAGRLSALLGDHGLKVPLTDCLLAVLAVENRVSLFSLDRHFGLIARHYPLELEDRG